MVDIGGTPFPVPKICAIEFWFVALDDTACTVPLVGFPLVVSAIAKLYPHTLSLTLADAYAFAYVTATAGTADEEKCERCRSVDSGSHPYCPSFASASSPSAEVPVAVRNPMAFSESHRRAAAAPSNAGPSVVRIIPE